MSLRIETLDQLREFITWAKDRYSVKITHREGGCKTCGWGGANVTDGYEFDDSALNENLEQSIDDWINQTFGR
jgi:hypothetical protein